MEDNKEFGKPIIDSLPSTETETTDANTEDVNTDDESTTETDDNKETTSTENETTETEEETEEETVEDDIDDKEKNTLEFEFENETTEETTDEGDKETKPLTEEAVIDFLKTNGLEVNSLKDLSKKDELPEIVAKFKKFNDETGRGHNDFYNLNRDWKVAPKDDVISEYLKFENEGLSDEDIAENVELMNITDDDKDNLSDTEIRQKELTYKSTYAKALKFMEAKSSEYKIPLEDKKEQPTPLTAEQIADRHRPYWEKRDAHLEKFNSLDYNIKDLGEIKIPLLQEHKDRIADKTQTNNSFFKDWLNKDGSMNVEKSNAGAFFSNEINLRYFITEMANQLNTMLVDKYSKTNRNVDLDKNQKPPSVTDNKGLGLEVVGETKNPQDNQMGTSIM